MTQHDSPRHRAVDSSDSTSGTDHTDPADPADAVEDPDASQQAAPERRDPTMLEQMGGLPGILASVVPVVVFVAVNAVAGLYPAIGASLLSAVGVAVWCVRRRVSIQPAISGLLAVGVAAFIAYRTGEAKGFFLLGIWKNLIYGGVFLLSVLVRWPLVGVVWHGISGHGQGWRADRRVRTGYDIATLTWVLVFAARYVVEQYLYDQDAETWLGVARLAMGLPLAAVAVLVTIWAVRRARRTRGLDGVSVRELIGSRLRRPPR